MSAIHRLDDHPTGVRPAFVGREVAWYRGRRRAGMSIEQQEAIAIAVAVLFAVAALAALVWALWGMAP